MKLWLGGAWKVNWHNPTITVEKHWGEPRKAKHMRISDPLLGIHPTKRHRALYTHSCSTDDSQNRETPRCHQLQNRQIYGSSLLQQNKENWNEQTLYHNQHASPRPNIQQSKTEHLLTTPHVHNSQSTLTYGQSVPKEQSFRERREVPGRGRESSWQVSVGVHWLCDNVMLHGTMCALCSITLQVTLWACFLNPAFDSTSHYV